jgi:hypothetical protein
MEEIVLEPKEEAFAQYLAQGMPKGRAYKKAGLTASENSKSWTRLANDRRSKKININKRVEQLKKELREQVKAQQGKTREDIDKKLDAIIEGVEEVNGDLPGWNEIFKAINLKAEINGWKSSVTEVKGGMKIRVRVVDE